jgi:translation initiation factor eIF-2B subunit gamma
VDEAGERPVAGVPRLCRLLLTLQASGFVEIVVAVEENDRTTAQTLSSADNLPDFQVVQKEEKGSSSLIRLVIRASHTKVTAVRVRSGTGSAQTLRQIEEETSLLPPTSHVVVLPGDIVLSDVTSLTRLVHGHRQVQPLAACTVLLNDVGEQDEHGVPLKESAKQKKGGLARDDEEIDYVALSYATDEKKRLLPRLIWKQAKLVTEHDKDMTGASPKVVLPKARLLTGKTVIRTDWSDVNVYCISPWVRRLITCRANISSLEKDLVPLLISRQFRGIAATFGRNADKHVINEVLSSVQDAVRRDSFPREAPLSPTSSATAPTRDAATQEYSVRAHVQKAALRTHTTASYLHANRELAHRISAATFRAGGTLPADPCLWLPSTSQVKSKFHSVVLPGCAVADKVTFKSVSVGRNCKLGTKCRLNNVVLLDDVTVGDNTILQNTVVGRSCVIGENCNLNDCQVPDNKTIRAGTKEKGVDFDEET